jgi:transcriptional regulator with XRE-family HTH domain
MRKKRERGYVLDNKIKIAKTVIRCRKLAGLDEKGLAEASGLSISYVRNLEGKCLVQPSLNTLLEIAEALNLCLWQFFWMIDNCHTKAQTEEAYQHFQSMLKKQIQEIPSDFSRSSN